MAVWITIVSVLPALSVLCILMTFLYIIYIGTVEACVAKWSYWIYKRRGGEKMVPVVFIRKNNNNKAQEDSREDAEAKESGEVDGVVLRQEEGMNVQGEGREAAEGNRDDNAVCIIPLSGLRKLQEQADPPPVQHWVQCLCIFPSKPKDFYTVLLEEGSPLLPSNAVLVDADKPGRQAWWCRGHHIFSVENIVWPRERDPPHNP
ncbi:uncharacterized protein LOC122974922 [Thunnus albacares]|uniref:uncharacterized protein LOC122974922 n=1 Tax=Thunnus albacares TaxID=8236 RepID=UPI001CF61F87|nr:uncharacterized protein LOC122974922 [Thunnus albacares]